MFIEVHILQNFAPSNLNRDDTGNPKDTEFGGVRRARISSQCIKRAIRSEKSFSKKTAVEPADRTRWITRLLARPLVQAGKEEALSEKVAEAFTNALGIGTEKDKKTDKQRSTVLLFLSKGEINEISGKLLTSWEAITAAAVDKNNSELVKIAKDYSKSFKDRTSAPDIAMFGRMLAERPD